MPATTRFLISAIVALLVGFPVLAGSPRDEALRLAPPDSAIVLVVQNLRDQYQGVRASPFAAWFPTSTLGKQLLASGDLRRAAQFVTPIFTELGTSPEDVLTEVLGDAVVFAYSPSPSERPGDERALFLIRPRKPETLTRLVDRINEFQTKSGELTGVVRRTANGETYFQRQKVGGSSEFYCFRGPVFAFSSSEADIRAVLERDRVVPRDGTPELVAKLTRLGVADDLAVLLINPRPLDAELDARVRTAKPEERAILERFREVWKATDAAAAYLALGRDLEVGLSVRFEAEKLPDWARGWLTGPKTPSALWAVIPDDALFAVGARFRAAELLDLVRALLPAEGKKALTAVVADSLGPIVGRDKLLLVLAALGPDWAVWAEPPRGEGYLPVVVAAVRVSGEDADGARAARAILQAVEFGFQTFRVMYNSGHPDQIELREEKDGPVTITSLVNEKAFPSSVRPSFAMKGGYLVMASDPDAIRRFRPPVGTPGTGGEVLVARFSGAATRSYLTAHGPRLAQFLATVGPGDEKDVAKLLAQFAAILEPIDRIDVLTRGDDSGLRVAMRVRFVQPLKK